MKSVQSEDILAQALRADAQRMTPDFSRKLHEDTLTSLNAGIAPSPRLVGSIRRSGSAFFVPAGFAIAAMFVGVLLVWWTKPVEKLPNNASDSVAVTEAEPVHSKLMSDDYAPARFMNSPGELMTRSLTLAQQAISEQYAMAYASTVRSAQESLPHFGFYSIPDIRPTLSH